jgi:hypothetical protein
MNIAQARKLIADLKKVRKQLIKEAKGLPDSDQFATVYCILADAATELEHCIDDLVPVLKEANSNFKKKPEEDGNRAKDFVYIGEVK